MPPGAWRGSGKDPLACPARTLSPHVGSLCQAPIPPYRRPALWPHFPRRRGALHRNHRQPRTPGLVSAVPEPGRGRVPPGQAHQLRPPSVHDRPVLQAEQATQDEGRRFGADEDLDAVRASALGRWPGRTLMFISCYRTAVAKTPRAAVPSGQTQPATTCPTTNWSASASPGSSAAGSANGRRTRITS
jgi:hypothetical protein